MDGDGAVVQGVVLAQGRTHDEEGQQVGAGLDDLGEGLLDVIEQHVLQEKVVDGVAGHAQLGEYAHRDAARIKLAGCVDNLARVLERASGVYGQGHGGNARKTLIVEGMEVHGSPSVLGLFLRTRRARALRRRGRGWGGWAAQGWVEDEGRVVHAGDEAVEGSRAPGTLAHRAARWFDE